MSTRGLVGFRENGKITGWYNPYDSYYECLGKQVLKKYKTHSKEELKKFFNKIIFVDKLPEEYYDLSEEIFDFDWFEGKYEWKIILKNDTEFIYNGLYCEYAYIFNLDEDIVEVYRGFFNEPNYNQRGYEAYNGKTYYTNKVFEINRGNIDIIKDLFNKEFSEEEEEEHFDKKTYWEQEFIDENTK